MRKLFLSILLFATCVGTSLLPSFAIDWPSHWVPEFDENGIDSEWARKLERKLLWGYVDKDGNYVIQPRYDKAEPFTKGCAEVEENGNTLYIDHNGKQIPQPPRLEDKAKNNDFRVIEFQKDIFDATGKKLIAPMSKGIKVYPFSEGLAAIRMPLRLNAQFYPKNLPIGYSASNTRKDDFGLCGYIDESGRIVISPRFRHAFKFVDGLAQVECGTQGGFINRSGHYLRPLCSQVRPFREGWARCTINHNNHFFIDKNSKVTLEHLQDSAELSEDRLAVKRNDKWSLVDGQGKTVCELDADDVGTFSEGLAKITKNHKTGFIDRSGAIKIPLRFEEAGCHFSEGVASVAVAPTDTQILSLLESKQDFKCGFIDTSGKLVIGANFRGARPFSEGLAPVRVGMKWGYIDNTGAIKIKPQFDDAYSFSERYAGVRLEHYWGFIDQSGAFVISPKFGNPNRVWRWHKSVGRFSEGVAFCKGSDFRWSYINRQGNVCSSKWPGDFPSEENNFHEGMALVQVTPGSNWRGHAYMNTHYQIVSKDHFARSSHAFSEGLAMVGYTSADEKQPPKAGFIDKRFKFVIAPKYSKARSFKEGLAAVALGEHPDYEFVGKWGYTDKVGSEVIDLVFDDAQDFSEGLAAIKIGTKWGFIDKTGKMKVSVKFDQVSKFSNDRALVKLGNRYGFINHTGKVVIPIQYWLAGTFSDGMALVVFPTHEGENVSTSNRLSFPIKDKKDLQDLIKHASGE